MLIREGIDDITPVGLSAVPLGAWVAPGTTTTFCGSLGASAPGKGQRTTGRALGSQTRILCVSWKILAC